MIQKQTNRAFEVFDKRNKSIGNFIIYLKVEDLKLNDLGAVVSGFYYIINEGEIFILDMFQESFPWEQIAYVEDTYLGAINSNSFKEVIIQRVLEFTNLQLQMEGGENYGTVHTDWV